MTSFSNPKKHRSEPKQSILKKKCFHYLTGLNITILQELFEFETRKTFKELEKILYLYITNIGQPLRPKSLIYGIDYKKYYLVTMF